jgi:hypothetical protein
MSGARLNVFASRMYAIAFDFSIFCIMSLNTKLIFCFVGCVATLQDAAADEGSLGRRQEGLRSAEEEGRCPQGSLAGFAAQGKPTIILNQSNLQNCVLMLIVFLLPSDRRHEASDGRVDEGGLVCAY